MRLLTAAARIEAGSLLMLLANLATAHWDAASSLLVLLAPTGASAPPPREGCCWHWSPASAACWYCAA